MFLRIDEEAKGIVERTFSEKNAKLGNKGEFLRYVINEVAGGLRVGDAIYTKRVRIDGLGAWKDEVAKGFNEGDLNIENFTFKMVIGANYREITRPEIVQINDDKTPISEKLVAQDFKPGVWDYNMVIAQSGDNTLFILIGTDKSIEEKIAAEVAAAKVAQMKEQEITLANFIERA